MIHILFENDAWLPPLRRALDEREVPHRELFVARGVFDIQADVPAGLWLNRMSPSAHARGHGDGIHYVRELLGVLEERGRRVVNGSHAFALEVSKVRQHAALEAMGIRTPRTTAVVGRERLKTAARRVPPPFLTKHNQGGKGLGVRLFRDHDAFDRFVDSGEADVPMDGVTLLQQFIEPPSRTITRVEIVGGKFLFAMRASTEQGFELCPSDACEAEDAFCPVGASGRFQPLDMDPADPLVASYIAFCAKHRIDVAGIEFVVDRDGQPWTYDVNMNTNDNSEVEHALGIDGMGAIPDLCARLLAEG